MHYSQILEECLQVAKERQKDYWPPEENFQRISDICRDSFDFNITNEDIAKVFIATKIARQLEKPKKDNLIDLINYIAILQSFYNIH